MLMSSWHRLPSSHVLRKRRKACQPIPGSSNPIALSRSVSQRSRSEEHTSELQSRLHLVCRLLLEKKKNMTILFLGLSGTIVVMCLVFVSFLLISCVVVIVDVYYVSHLVDVFSVVVVPHPQ